ncbi:MAG: hypothetical protein D6690_16815 [Nitrospirae bacterium]|nr:MAG: hypothetical protein D6690_16815 [Nitrospirota bacterium]
MNNCHVLAEEPFVGAYKVFMDQKTTLENAVVHLFEQAGDKPTDAYFLLGKNIILSHKPHGIHGLTRLFFN